MMIFFEILYVYYVNWEYYSLRISKIVMTSLAITLSPIGKEREYNELNQSEYFSRSYLINARQMKDSRDSGGIYPPKY